MATANWMIVMSYHLSVSLSLSLSLSLVSECVGSRDPYCVWSDQRLECVQSPLTATDTNGQGTVDDTQ